MTFFIFSNDLIYTNSLALRLIYCKPPMRQLMLARGLHFYEHAPLPSPRFLIV